MPTSKISTARESLARVNARIEAESNPRYRKWIEVNRDHWWGEVIGDVDLVMSTMTRGPICYGYDGHPFLKQPGGTMELVNNYEATRAMYESIQAMGSRAAGPIDEERFMLDPDGMFFYSILTVIYPGVFITHHSEPIDPEGLYAIRVNNLTKIRFDEDDLMMGEEIINGEPLVIKKVDASAVAKLVDGPIDFF